jgi:hypothetical protein
MDLNITEGHTAVAVSSMPDKAHEPRKASGRPVANLVTVTRPSATSTGATRAAADQRGEGRR